MRACFCFLLALAASVGCDSPPPEVDSGPSEDASVPACTRDSDCDDGLFCNGPERCSIGEGDEESMCVAGAAPCAGGTCDEAAGECGGCDTDADGDGAMALECGGDDCDDNDPLRYPGNPEVCDVDHVDEDCNPATFGSLDSDGDGAVSDACCNTGADGALACGSDCDDARANVSALASEVCDDVDNDCDTFVDEGVRRTFYPDSDGDSFGDPDGASEDACTPPDGFVEDATDCNDGEREINPVAAERCATGADEDCDGETDESGAVRYYVDSDGDSFGDVTRFIESEDCEPPAGHVAIAGDCNDASGAYYPNAPEVCDGRDTSCNLPGDAGGTDPSEDGDGDMHAASTATCAVGDVGFGSYPRDDCDDAAPTVYGGAPELCDRRDTACAVDGGVLATEDMDDDGHAPLAASCSGGFPRDDCDDAAPTVYGGAPELCDRLDNACASGGGARPAEDMDDDGHAPIGAACSGGPRPKDDCRDDVATTYPGADELCNRVDDVCASGGGVRAVEDMDDDGFAPLGADCAGGPRPPTDCDDNAPGTFPGALERCGSGDENCNAIDDTNDGEAARWCGPFATCDGQMQTCHIEGPLALTRPSSFALQSGVVYGWGQPLSGPLRLGAEPVAGVGAATAIYGTDESACAILDTGVVRCWGGGSPFNAGGTVDPPADQDASVTGALELSLSNGATCARVGETIRCWGSNLGGGVGDGTRDPRTTPLTLSFNGVLGEEGGPAQLVAGIAHHCALARSGSVFCWGYDTDGRLGRGTVPGPGPGDQIQTPGLVSNLSDATSLAAGGALTCAVRNDSSVACWGSYIVDGQTLPVFNSNVPVPLAGLSGAAQLAVGDNHACARLLDGTVRCWGDNVVHQLGDGTATPSETPVVVSGLSDVVSIAAGARHTCALTQSGAIRCWGDHLEAQLGDGTTSETVPFPVPVDSLTDATELFPMAAATCALSSANGLQCWGSGPVGDGTALDRTPPTTVLSGATAIAAGGSQGARFMLLADNTGYSWGSGHLGTGGAATDTPTLVPGITGASILGRGLEASHACVYGSGGLSCWGTNEFGQLGTGDMAASTTPMTSGFTFGGTVTHVGTGLFHTCVAHGTVSCFGIGGPGLLGDGLGESSLTPVTVSGLSDVVELAKGRLHTCARLASGAVRCWGFNQQGRLGDGTTVDRFAPVDVVGLSDAISIGANSLGGCAARTDGSVSCWGSGTSGHLGDGTLTVSAPTPVQVMNLGDATQVVSGSAACALRSGGVVSCWGPRASLGNAAYYDTPSVPVSVIGLP